VVDHDSEITARHKRAGLVQLEAAQPWAGRRPPTMGG